MKTREQIIAELLQQYKFDREKIAKTDYYEALAEEQGQAFVDQMLAEPDVYPKVIEAELAKRLTEESYLTCDDFDHLDVACCNTCHTCYPHYEMWIVVLSDGRHAWVCDSIEHVLMRRTRTVPSSPDQETALQLLDEILGGCTPDPVKDALHEASLAAKSDEEKLHYCLKYAHHIHKRKRGHKTVETLVNRALRLPGRGPAQRSKTA